MPTPENRHHPHPTPAHRSAATPAGSGSTEPAGSHPTEALAPVTAVAPAPQPQRVLPPTVILSAYEEASRKAIALSYAERRWHVLPLEPGTKRPAWPNHQEGSCWGRDPVCRKAGGHVGWEARALTKPMEIIEAWTTPLDVGVGIACGPSGLVVIDCDMPKGDAWPDAWRIPGITCGADVLAYVAESLGEVVPATYTVATPSGGRHLYFRHPAGPAIRNTIGTARGPLGWLVDVRAHGGQVVAPPTRSAVGAYTVLDRRDPVPLPEWIAERLRPKAIPTAAGPRQADGPHAQPRPDTGDPWAPSRRRRYLDAAIDAESARVREAVKGQRNHTLFKAAAALGELVAGGELDPDYVRDVLLDASAAHLLDPGYPRFQAGQTITSGLRHGANRPRRYQGPA